MNGPESRMRAAASASTPAEVPLRVLMLEDSPADADANIRALRKDRLAIECRRVETCSALEEALDAFRPDVVLIDCNLPSIDGRSALEAMRRRRECAPAIIVTAALGDEAAVDLLKAGAADYVLKDRLARLGPAVRRALADEQARRSRQTDLERLAADARRARALVDNTGDMVVVVDRAGVVRYANAAVQKTAGYPPAQVVGRDLRDFLTSGDAGLVTEQLAALADRPEELALGRWRFRHADGMERISEWRARNLEAVPEVGGFVFTCQDITAREHAAEALRQSEARYRQLFENMLEGYAHCRMLYEDGVAVDFEYIEVNAAFEALTGLKGVAGKRIGALVPDFRQMNPELMQTYARVAAGGAPERLETFVEGLSIWLSVSVYGGGSGHFVAVFENITERRLADTALRQSELRLRALLENVGDVIALVDDSGIVKYVSPACEQVIGLPPGGVVGRNFTEFMHPEDAARAWRETADRMGHPETVRFKEERLRHKDGSWRTVATAARNLVGVDGVDGVVVTMHDVTERKAAEAAMARNLAILQTQQEASVDGILVVDAAGKVVSQNRRFLDMWGVPPELRGEIADEGLLRNVAGKVADGDAFLARVIHLYAHPEEKSHEEIALRDGRIFERHSAPMRAADGQYIGRIWFFRDITERKVAEDKLRLFRALVDQSNDAVEVVDVRTLQLVDVNEKACKDLGYSREELLGLKVPDFDAEYSESRVEEIRRRLQSEGAAIFESVHRRKDGSTYPVELSARAVDMGRPYILTMARDITERKRAERALAESEVRFRTMVEAALDPVAIVGPDGVIVYTSPATPAVSGFEPAELVGSKFTDYVHPGDAAKVGRAFAAVVAEPVPVRRMLARMRHKDGRWLNVEASARNLLDTSPINGVVVTLRDVSERERYTRALAAISAGNAALVHAGEENALLQELCRILVDIGGYRMVWIGLAQSDPARTVAPVAWAGLEDGYLQQAVISWADTVHGRGPSGRAIRSRQTQFARDFATDPHMEPWRPQALARGYASAISLPLTIGGAAFGALTLYAGVTDAFDAEEVALLEQLAGEVAYGVNVLRGRRRHAEDLERLERSMEATIHAIASTVERRDPYTAGHQRRVAQLCVAIAGELGLSPERTHGLQLAASIFDVGKIDIPAEILARPGALSAIEYALVRAHAQSGYEIVRNVAFPWPIADMIWQHHEKLDGSGYPRGLKGEQIMLEARILAVADVVEAMSSHRPYRPALGVDAALAEISQGQGTRFDVAVVGACIRLFRERGFAFDQRP